MTGTACQVFADAEALAQHAAEFLTTTLEATTGRAAVCLSGGSTPKRLYELLAAPPLRDRLPWNRVHWFWGDERFVPTDDPASNYRMTRLAMLAAVPIPVGHVHPVPTGDLTPEQAATQYERQLQDFYGSPTLDATRPLFDVTLLGLGEDGHTASLFPDTAALDERAHWVAAVVGAKPEPRISLTYPALDSSAHVMFLVAGAGKYPVLERLSHHEDLPAGRVRPTGMLHWFLDQAAADGALHQ
jgi:6-phosphogluconolactonase